MLEANAVAKSYGQVRALVDVSIAFVPGEIHAVVGENGAGKSTLMGVLAGFIVPSSGSVSLQGNALPSGRPFECRRLGVAMIHQHFTLVPEFTVLENLALARVDRLNAKLDLHALAAPALNLAKELGWEVDAATVTSTLPVGAQQRLEILKNLANDATVVIFDEPTAVLTASEIEELFRVLRKLRDAGKVVILIAHKLSEVFAVADRVTVLRRGQEIASASIAEVDQEAVAKWMVGDLPEALRKPAPARDGEGLVVRGLQAFGDRGEECLRGLELEVSAGEILGIGGVDGNGQLELAEVLAGVRKPTSGILEWHGKRLDRTVRTGYIPQDRQSDGLAVSMSVEDNMLVSGVERRDLVAHGILLTRKIRLWAEALRQRFDIRVRRMSDPASFLSGGNQQKVVVARVIGEDPELLIVANPTRGLDLRSSAFVQSQILDAAERGSAVVLISADLDELAALAHRTLFISRGRLSTAAAVSGMVGGG